MAVRVRAPTVDSSSLVAGMYRKHWELSSAPYGQGGSLGFYRSHVHEEAIARLRYVVEEGYRIAILTGAPGTGKTTVLRHAGSLFRKGPAVSCYGSALGSSAEEFPWLLAQGLGISLTMGELSVPRLWGAVLDQLRVNAAQQIRTILMWDDAHFADHGVLMGLLRLAHWQSNTPSLVTILLASDSTALHQPVFRPFRELCPLRVELEPWGLEDTVGYLSTGLERAGRTTNLFDVCAIEEIHRLSAGIPRAIRRLAELSLVAGAADRLSTIDASIVASAHREFQLSDPPIACVATR